MESSGIDEAAGLPPGTSEFWNQFAGSSSANVLILMLLGLYMGVKKLCNRNSRCKSHIHCCCLDLDVRDKTMRGEVGHPDLTDEAPGVRV